LIVLHEHRHQAWAAALAPLPVAAKDLAAAARAAGQDHLDEEPVATSAAPSDHLLARGHAANPPAVPPPAAPPKQGRPSRTPEHNLLARLTTHRAAVLALVRDLRVPCDDNQAERDLRLLKVPQKITGGFRTTTGAAPFARIRGSISTLRKQGVVVLTALEGVFAGSPLMPSLAS
jgi:transposase